ncbi:MAG: alpha/beta hydrolase [Lachnospiraceae bacterium]|nr:alpha/beta hydrolase [Lachnospiraceae bacterium]
MNVSVNGYNINYKESGTGERTAVMLQGWGTTLEVYDSVAASVNDGYRFIQFDLPGFGKSDEPAEAWNVDAYTGFFISFMEALGIKSAVLIGHSYGGRMILKLAARENLPFDIEKIVLIDSAGIMPQKSLMQRIKIRQYKILKKVFGNKLIYALFPELVDDWRNRQGSADYRNASPIMRKCLVMAVNEDLTELLPKVRQETLLIWGDKDTATPISDAHKMEKMIPSAGLCVLEGCGHYSFLEKPAQFKSIMRAFLKPLTDKGDPGTEKTGERK